MPVTRSGKTTEQIIAEGKKARKKRLAEARRKRGGVRERQLEKDIRAARKIGQKTGRWELWADVIHSLGWAKRRTKWDPLKRVSDGWSEPRPLGPYPYWVSDIVLDEDPDWYMDEAHRTILERWRPNS